MRFITNLGDAAVLLPVSAVLLACLLYGRSRRAAVIWAATLAACVALTLALKIGFRTCGAALPFLDIRSPSGHTSLGTTFYGCAALMLAVERERWTRIALMAATALLVAAIAASRILLHAHTLAEVIGGLVIGLLCVAWFAWRYFERPVRPFPWPPLLLAVVALALVLHGRHLGAEGLVGQIAQLLRLGGRICA